MKRLKQFLSLSVVIYLTGCGGGGSTAEEKPTTNSSLSASSVASSSAINSSVQSSIAQAISSQSSVMSSTVSLPSSSSSSSSISSSQSSLNYTNISGIVNADTTLTLSNSPYLITNDIQIAYGTKLQIEAGVRIDGGSHNVKVFGELIAEGTKDAKVNFNQTNLIPGNGATVEFFNINLDYVDFISGSIYSPTGNAIYGSISVTNSVVKNIPYMYLWYPVRDCNFEKNVFINFGGFSTGTADGIYVHIKNNAFYNQLDSNFVVENWASYGTSNTEVTLNSFLNLGAKTLSLPSGYANANLIGTNNYWGTNDTDQLNSMIYDKNDDLGSAGYISFLPILVAPDTNTPDPTPHLP